MTSSDPLPGLRKGIRRHGCSTIRLQPRHLLLFSSGLFVTATLFFGTQCGYYNTDQYDGNGTAH